MIRQVYFASPLFSNMERAYNASLVARIRQRFPPPPPGAASAAASPCAVNTTNNNSNDKNASTSTSPNDTSTNTANVGSAASPNAGALPPPPLLLLRVYVPQEQTAINDKTRYADSTAIARYDTDALLASSLVVAVLDGPTIDVGVASEIGVAYQAGIPIVGLYTDSRQGGATNAAKLQALQQPGESQFPYANLYTVGLVKLRGCVVTTEEALLDAMQELLSTTTPTPTATVVTAAA